jgi:hypothetical protein
VASRLRCLSTKQYGATPPTRLRAPRSVKKCGNLSSDIGVLRMRETPALKKSYCQQLKDPRGRFCMRVIEEKEDVGGGHNDAMTW